MAPNIFKQAGEMWRAVAGAADMPEAGLPRSADARGGRVGRVGSRLSSGELSRRGIAALATAALCWLCVPELALSQPANINLINLNNGQL
jgi:hypothetical protein